MIAPEDMLAKVKMSLRISHNALDADIQDNIAACLTDLLICGVVPPPEEDMLILNAVKLWCRAAFSDDPAKVTLFREGYDSLKSSLMMSSRYREGVAGDD